MTIDRSKLPRRVVVTGASGFIGRHVVRELRGRGVAVSGIGRPGSRADGDTVDATLDLTESGALAQYVEKSAAVIHLAASADVRGSVAAPLDDFRNNVVATLNVLETVREAGSRLLFASTPSVCSASAPLPFHESSEVRPSSPHAAAKASGEAYCHAYHQTYGVAVVIARLFSVYGPGMRRFAIHDFFVRMQEAPTGLTIYGDGTQTRDYIYVEDAVRALLLVLCDGQPGEIYNVASGRSRTILEVAQSVAAASGLAGMKITTDNRASRAELTRIEADTRKLDALGFRCSMDFEAGVRETVRWLRQAKSSAAVA